MRIWQCILGWWIIATPLLLAQTITLSRVGVVPEKDHFVTATKTFTVEINVAGVNDCSAVSFELQFTDARNVRFAGSWTALDFPASNVVVVDNSNYVTGIGSVTVIAMLGTPPNAGGLIDPAVVQLDFIVPPDAIHNANIVFNFRNAEAVVAANGGTVVRLSGTPTIFNVHSYVDVWPGDANNDGIVDSRDGTIIALFYDEGGPGSRITGYPRKPASTIWAAQPALAWDSVRVTYADCDGSGRIDINDVLVIYANFSKTHSKTTPVAPTAEWQVPESDPQVEGEDVQLVPIELHTGVMAMGVAARVSWEQVRQDYEVVGILRGNIFPPTKGFFARIFADKAYCDIAAGNLYPDPEVPIEGVLAYLKVRPKSADPPPFHYQFLKLNGIRRNGALFPLILSAVPAVSQEMSPLAVTYTAGECRVTGLQPGERLLNFQLFTLTGQPLLSLQPQNPIFSVPTTSLPPGVYPCIVRTNRRIERVLLPAAW